MVRFGIKLACVIGFTSTVSAPAWAAPSGVIKGTVKFEGAPPDRIPLRRDTDPYCAKGEAFADDVIVTTGKLKDVIVRVKSGSLPAVTSADAAAMPPVLVDQKDCRYSPHVVGVVAGQKLAIRNSDGTFHNVHGSIAGALIWNKPAVPGQPDLELTNPAKPGDVIDIACDVHPWMHAYAVVQDHAAFAVTGEDGSFELKGLPPGTYTLEAWHPALGKQTVNVTIGKAAKPVSAQLSYKRTDLKK